MSADAPRQEWFDRPRPGPDGRGTEVGLRFGCTMCGNCCTGPEGYVLYTPEEGRALAARLGISDDEFVREYTKETFLGRSLREKTTPWGLDCVFLDREKVPGKAVCGVYEDRPAQCRTWPFWSSMLRSEANWIAAKRTCPGLDRGKLVPPQQIRILRSRVEI